MNDIIQSNIALNNLGRHTFRDGKLLATIDGFSLFDDMLIIEYVDCFWDDEKIEISLPLNFIGYNRDGENPVLFFYKIFKNFVSMGRI